jgi:O-antigen ligase
MKQEATIDRGITQRDVEAILLRLRSFPPGWVAAFVCAAILVLAISLYFTMQAAAISLFAVGVLIPLLWIVWARPVFGVIALIFLTASFVQPDLIDLRILGGGLTMRDLALIGLLVGGVVRKLLYNKLEFPWWRVSLPLLTYFGIAALSAVYAILLQDVTTNWALSEFRAIFYLATFFAVVWNIDQVKDVFILFVGLIILADLTALAIFLQQFLGRDSLLLSAMLGNGWYIRNAADAAGDFGDVRVVPPGNVMMFMVAIMVFALLLQANQPRGRRLFLAAQSFYLTAGILFTYTRAEWIACAMAVAMVVLFLPRLDKARLARYLATIGVVFALVYALFTGVVQQFLAQQFVGNVAARALTIFTPDTTLDSSSLQWRLFENGKALDSIAMYPVFGVGLGNSYRDVTLLQWEDRRFYFRKTRFVHNSYLYIAVKMGIIGLAAFLVFCLAFILVGWRAFRKMAEGDFKRLTIATLASFAGLLFWANTELHFMTVSSTAVVGLMVGMVASMARLKAIDSLQVRAEATPVQSINLTTPATSMNLATKEQS